MGRRVSSADISHTGCRFPRQLRITGGFVVFCLLKRSIPAPATTHVDHVDQSKEAPQQQEGHAGRHLNGVILLHDHDQVRAGEDCGDEAEQADVGRVPVKQLEDHEAEEVDELVPGGDEQEVGLPEG